MDVEILQAKWRGSQKPSGIYHPTISFGITTIACNAAQNVDSFSMLVGLWFSAEITLVHFILYVTCTLKMYSSHFVSIECTWHIRLEHSLLACSRVEGELENNYEYIWMCVRVLYDKIISQLAHSCREQATLITIEMSLATNTVKQLKFCICAWSITFPVQW